MSSSMILVGKHLKLHSIYIRLFGPVYVTCTLFSLILNHLSVFVTCKVRFTLRYIAGLNGNNFYFVYGTNAYIGEAILLLLPLPLPLLLSVVLFYKI